MKKKEILILLLAIITVTVACKKESDLEQVRFFRPVSAAALVADSNAILVSWLKIQGVESYTVQVSRDTFVTIDKSVNVQDSGSTLVTDLQWDKLYQVRIRANAADTAYNSKWSDLGAIRTPRFPTILKAPFVGDITETAVRVSWTTSGLPVSSIRILKAADSAVVSTTALAGADLTNESKIISGLTPATPYIIFLYSGSTVRGWVNFSTRTPYTGSVINLTGITGRPSVLADTIPIIPSGSTVVLKRGEIYNIASAVNLSKSITIVGGGDLTVAGQAVITMPANFNITSGSVIDSIVFSDVVLRGTDFASKYVFNINTACTIGKMSFIGCTAEIFRGVVRLQSQPAIINNFLVENSIMDSLSGYGVLTVDVATAKADKIVIRNSTIYKAQNIIVSRNNSTSVNIEHCTINEAPNGGGSNYYVDYNTSSSNNVTNGIVFLNNIFGVGKANGTAQTIRGVRANAASSVSGANNYRTSDQVSLGNDIPNIITYTRPSTQLWVDPANGKFTIADASFPGRSTTGDPRWRIQ